jgi:hypothetical protein
MRFIVNPIEYLSATASVSVDQIVVVPGVVRGDDNQAGGDSETPQFTVGTNGFENPKRRH